VVVVVRQVSSGYCFTPSEQWLLLYAKLVVVVVLRQVSSGCCFTQSELTWRKITTTAHLA
jgi:hypothetical protein